MGFPKNEVLTVTTDGDGDGSASSASLFIGPLWTIVYTPDATAPFTSTFTVLVASAVTGQTLWSEASVGASAVTRNPRQALHGTDGGALLFAAAGEPQAGTIMLSNEAVTVTVSGGGDTKRGTFRLIGG